MKPISYLASFEAKGALDEKGQLLIGPEPMRIEGVAVDSSVNRNRWRLKDEDIKYVAEKLKGRQLRLKHSDDPRDVIGKVNDAWLEGSSIKFMAELDDEGIKRKIARKYLDSVSIQVLARQFVCSKCGKATRDDDGHLIHDYRGCAAEAHEVVEGPEPLELSIVTQGAYDAAKFIGFAAAMDAFLQLPKVTDESGANSEGTVTVAPEDKRSESKLEVEKKMSTEDKGSQSATAQHVIPVAPDASAPKGVTYEELFRIMQGGIKWDERFAKLEERLKKLEEVPAKKDEKCKDEDEEAKKKDSKKKQPEDDEDEDDEGKKVEAGKAPGQGVVTATNVVAPTMSDLILEEFRRAGRAGLAARGIKAAF